MSERFTAHGSMVCDEKGGDWTVWCACGWGSDPGKTVTKSKHQPTATCDDSEAACIAAAQRIAAEENALWSSAAEEA